MQSTALVQNWHFPSKDGNALNVSWERYNSFHAAPQVNFTASERTNPLPLIVLHRSPSRAKSSSVLVSCKLQDTACMHFLAWGCDHASDQNDFCPEQGLRPTPSGSTMSSRAGPQGCPAQTPSLLSKPARLTAW